MDKKQAAMGTYVMPKPAVIVSCRGKDGKNNALVVAYASNCSYDPPMAMVGIVPTRHSYKIIKESGCFIINLASPEMKQAYDYLGSHSGRDENKIAKLKLNIKDGEVVDAPVITGCPVNIECTIVDSIITGSHEMFVGKVEYVHAPSDCISEDGKIDFSKIKLLWIKIFEIAYLANRRTDRLFFYSLNYKGYALCGLCFSITIVGKNLLTI